MCTHQPTLAQQLPLLRGVPAHFVTWGDGSSDEMCLGLMWTSQSLPNPKYPVEPGTDGDSGPVRAVLAAGGLVLITVPSGDSTYQRPPRLSRAWPVA